ncbi:MAG: hypothetical protein V9G09_05835 [Candidatus Nanopelagicales bacterium]
MPAPRYTLRRGTQPQEFNKWSITVREFRRMLPQLYANDWVLVDLESLIRKVRTPRGPVYKMAKLKLPPREEAAGSVDRRPQLSAVHDRQPPQLEARPRWRRKRSLPNG